MQAEPWRHSDAVWPSAIIFVVPDRRQMFQQLSRVTMKTVDDLAALEMRSTVFQVESVHIFRRMAAKGRLMVGKAGSTWTQVTDLFANAT